jgi:hypothetical protein
MKAEDRIDSPCLPYRRVQQHWTLLHDLLGGTYAMRQAGTRWLPQEPKEDSSHYAIRLERAVLFNGFKTAVDDLVDRPFARPLTLTGELGTLEILRTDCTRTKRSLDDFAKDLLRSAAIHGVAHVLVDFPNVPDGATLAEVGGEVRPYFVLVAAPDLIGWQFNDRMELVEVRIRLFVDEPVGAYGQQRVEKILVYKKDAWELHRRDEDGAKFSLESKGTHTFGGVPLVSVYLNKQEEMVADPPLEDLAMLNLAHWQSSADQRNALRFARIGLLCAVGFTAEEFDQGFVIGPNYVVKSVNPQAKLSYVEHSGSAIKIGQDDLDRLERQMEVLGLQPVVERTSESTATGKLIDDSNSASSLKSWVASVNRGLSDACAYAGRWIGQETEVAVALFDDFGVSVRATNELDVLLKSRIAGEISRDTYLEELKRRGVLNETLDVDEEIERLGADLLPDNSGEQDALA